MGTGNTNFGGIRSGACVPVTQTVANDATTDLFKATIEDADTTASNFQFQIDKSNSFTGNGQTWTDPLIRWGFNADNSDTTKPQWVFQMEGDYWTNTGFDNAWRHQLECHLAYTAVGGSPSIRVWSASIDPALNEAELTFSATTLVFQDAANNPWGEYAGTWPGTFTFSVPLHIVEQGGTANLQLNFNTGGAAQVTFENQQTGIAQWAAYCSDGNYLTFIDKVNTVYSLTLRPGAGVNGQVQLGSVFLPVQAATASAPTYVKGGMYFDTTLNKTRQAGATVWESIVSGNAAAPTGVTTGFTAGGGTAMNSASTSTGGTGTTAYTFGDLVAALKTFGVVPA